MGRNAVLGASVTACFIALSGCSANHYVQRGADLYGEGRFVEADEVFDRSEPRVASAPIEQRAAYAAYRGATFIALGDLGHARYWLEMAREVERSHPGTLRPSELAFLDGAWRVLTEQLPLATSSIASSSQVPSPSVDSGPPGARDPRRAPVPH